MDEAEKKYATAFLRKAIALEKTEDMLSMLAIAIDMWADDETKELIVAEYKYLTHTSNNPIRDACKRLEAARTDAVFVSKAVKFLE